jgi:Flp pilus assembly protein TadG
MLTRLRAIQRSQRREEGATTLEFLMSFVSVLFLLLVIVQVTIVFVNANLVNHALSLASQEASARGRIDNSVRALYLSHLPTYLAQQCNSAGYGACLDSSSLPAFDGTVTPGGSGECTAKGQVFDVTAVYQQDMSMLRALGVTGAPVINMRRSVRVASQSLNRTSLC